MRQQHSEHCVSPWSQAGHRAPLRLTELGKKLREAPFPCSASHLGPRGPPDVWAGPPSGSGGTSRDPRRGRRRLRERGAARAPPSAAPPPLCGLAPSAEAPRSLWGLGWRGGLAHHDSGDRPPPRCNLGLSPRRRGGHIPERDRSSHPCPARSLEGALRERAGLEPRTRHSLSRPSARRGGHCPFTRCLRRARPPAPAEASRRPVGSLRLLEWFGLRPRARCANGTRREPRRQGLGCHTPLSSFWKRLGGWEGGAGMGRGLRGPPPHAEATASRDPVWLHLPLRSARCARRPSPPPPPPAAWTLAVLPAAGKRGVFSHLTRVSINSARAPANPRQQRQKEAN